MPPVLIVQHIPQHFSYAFAERLNRLSALEVAEASENERLQPGQARVAPGDYHLTLSWSAGSYRTHLNQEPMVWHQRPAVDVLFHCAAQLKAGQHCVAAILTGMGRDGAEGMLALRNQGATTFSQSADTCVVYGMPKAAEEAGSSQHVVPLQSIAQRLASAATQTPATA